MTRLATAPLAVLLLLAGCATPESRVHDKLLAAGIKPRLADCLAPKLARRLSIAELEKLGRAAKLAKPVDGAGVGDPPHHLGLREFADRLQAVDDPHIVEVVTRAGVSCALRG